jgi:hypothetical protein
MKTLTRKELEARKAQAVHFARDVREDDELADEIEDESLEQYAERRHIRVRNPKGVRTMPVQTRRELIDRIKELEDENEELRSRLEEIGDLASTEEEDDEDEDEGE